MTPINLTIDTRAVSDRLEEMALYIMELSEKDPKFASTKLNKLVWASDFAAFKETGRTISAASYQREKFGPVPRAMPIILERLEREGRMKWKSVQMGPKSGNRPFALAQPNLSAFSQREVAIVAKVVAENFGKDGSTMSNETHKHLAWKVTQNGETIPFSAWLVTKPHITEEHRAIAAKIAARLSAQGNAA